MTSQTAEIQSDYQTRDQDVILDVRHLKTYYPVLGGLLRRRIGWVKAVDDVSFAVKRGETLGMVGESGCGKTTIGRSLIRLLKVNSGEIVFEGRDILKLPADEMKKARRDLQIISRFGALAGENLSTLLNTAPSDGFLPALARPPVGQV